MWDKLLRSGFDRIPDSMITKEEFFDHIVERAVEEGQTFGAPSPPAVGNASFWFGYFQTTLNASVRTALDGIKLEIMADGVNWHKAHRDAALFRNAMNFTTDVRPPLAASDKLRACTGLVDQPNRQMMQALWQALDPNGDGQLTIHDYVLT